MKREHEGDVIVETQNLEVWSEIERSMMGTESPPLSSGCQALGRLVKQEQFNHSYPFCWRTHTPLIYKAVPSW